METVLILIISLLALVLIGFARARRAYRNQLNELRAVHQETCNRLETAQCRFRCKHLSNEILEAEFLEDK